MDAIELPPGAGTSASPRTASLTIRVIRGPGTITIEGSLRDETTIPLLQHAATIVVGQCEPRHVEQVLEQVLLAGPLAKCEDLGWRELSAESRADLRRWTEHAVLARLLQFLARGIDDARSLRAAADARDRERAVGVVARPGVDPPAA